MGMDVGQPGSPPAALDGLLDARLGQAAPLAEPQPRLTRIGSLRAHAQVPIERLTGLVAKRTGTRPTAIAPHDRRLLVEVDVLKPQSGEFAAAHPAVEEEPDDRVVAAVLEVGPGAGVEQLPQLGLPQDRWGSLGQLGRAHRGHRAAIDLAFGRQPLEELLKRP